MPRPSGTGYGWLQVLFNVVGVENHRVDNVSSITIVGC